MRRQLLAAVVAVVSFNAGLVVSGGPVTAAEPGWVRVEGGPGHGEDTGRFTLVDATTGTTHVVGQVATRPDDGLDDLFVASYDRNGIRVQARTWDLPDVESRERPNGAALDPRSGTLYVAVALDHGEGSAVLSFTADGSLAWIRRLPPVGGSVIEFSDVVVDAGTGAVYATGVVSDDVLADRATTLAYDDAGRLLWQRTRGDGQDSHVGLDVVVDASRGIVYSAGARDLWAYDRAGRPLWSALTAELGWFTAVDVDRRSGTVVVTGSTAAEGGGDFVTAAYSPTGRPLWSQREDDGLFAVPTALAIDSARGIVVVTGYGSSGDYQTVAYTTTGQTLWEQRYDGPAGALDQPVAAAVDSRRGLVYVTGWSGSGADIGDPYAVATVAYSLSGDRLRVNRYQNDADNYPQDLAVDLVRGRVSVTGSTQPVDDLGAADVLTLGYPPAA